MPHDFKGWIGQASLFLPVSSFEEWELMTWASPSELLGHSHASRKYSGPHWLRARLPCGWCQDCWLEGRSILDREMDQKRDKPLSPGRLLALRRLKTASTMRQDLLWRVDLSQQGGTLQLKGSGRCSRSIWSRAWGPWMEEGKMHSSQVSAWINPKQLASPSEPPQTA